MIATKGEIMMIEQCNCGCTYLRDGEHTTDCEYPEAGCQNHECDCHTQPYSDIDGGMDTLMRLRTAKGN